MKRAIAVGLLCALGACGGHNYMWTKDGATQQEFDMDVKRCEYEAIAATATYGSSSPTARTHGGAVGQGIGQGIGQAMARQEVGIACMRAKGYSQEPIR